MQNHRYFRVAVNIAIVSALIFLTYLRYKLKSNNIQYFLFALWSLYIILVFWRNKKA